MADERMVPLDKTGELVNMAMTPRDFFTKRTIRKDGAPFDAQDGTEHFMTAAEAGYRLTGYYESKEVYDGPKTLRQYEREQEEKRAERQAARSEPAKAVAPADDKPKAEAKKD